MSTISRSDALKGNGDNAAVRVRCAHCSLHVPAGLIEPEQERQFCCHACRTAYDFIHASGLDRYYDIRRASAGKAAPARSTGARFEQFDDPAFHERYTVGEPDGSATTRFLLEGVHCAACVWLLERLSRLTSGVVESRLEFRRAVLTVRWRPDETKLSAVARAIDGLGYAPHQLRHGSREAARASEDRRFLIRLGVAGAIAGNVMLIAFALYGGMFSGMETQFASLFRWTSAVLAAVAIAWPGRIFFTGAVAALRARTLHMDLPIAIGLAAGGVTGLVNTVRGSGEIYFDTLTVLVFLLLVGRWIQHRQQRRAADAVELLFSLTPSVARIVTDEGVREAPIEAVRIGDIIEVIAGGAFPVDGVIIQGATSVDASVLTGESRPVNAGIDDHVAAGATNLASPVRIRAEATGDDTRIGRLMQLVETGAARRTPIVRTADQLAGVFTAVVLSVAALTFIGWTLIAGVTHGVEYATALLIVTCPCALALATPLAIVAGVGQAARRGILIKGGDAVEALAREPGVILLDKTGTLTQGAVEVVRWRGDDDLKPRIAAAEARCEHPIARAFARAFGCPVDQPDELEQHVGGGIIASFGDQRLTIGSPDFVSSHVSMKPAWLDDALAEFASEALTPVVVARDGEIVAAAGLGDPLRDDAAEAIQSLRDAGWTPMILSGDHQSVVNAVGAALDIPPEHCRGQCSPEDKLAVVEDCAKSGKVVMVGDGVNDAAALAAATVGVAVHGGTEASLSAADVSLSRPGLTPLVELIRGARRTLTVIRRNLALSLAYNAACGLLAVLGVINPLIAAVLMPLSSLTVVTSSYKARTFGVNR